MAKKLVSTVVDLVKHPDKYRKGFVVPAAILVYALSSYLGADSKTVLEVEMVLTSYGVYRIPNATA
jgi:hypothetical protein